MIDPRFTPPPTQVLEALYQTIINGEIFRHIGYTLVRAFVGYTLAMLIAIPVGTLMGEFKVIFRLLEPTVEMLRPMPSSAIIPVAILLFGIGDEMGIFVVCFGAVWATIISTIDSIRRVESVLIDTGKTLNLSRSQIILYIVLPSASPGIVTGMRISLAISLILALTVEMIAGGKGLGFYIIDTERAFRYPEMFAGIVCAGILGYFINKVFFIAEHRFLRWHYSLISRER